MVIDKVTDMYYQRDHDIGDIVYLKTDPGQYTRMVTRITVTPTSIVYELKHGTEESWHFGIEISKTKNDSMSQCDLTGVDL